MNLLNLTEINQNELHRIREIFFKCSFRKNFESQNDRDQFFNKWTQYYLEADPKEILVAVNKADQIVGYLMGCSDSRAAIPWMMERIAYYDIFEDCFETYPAHLHINCDPEVQGRGIGSKLIQAYCDQKAKEGLSGVHLVTTTDAPNVAFYKKNGFEFTLERQWNQSQLLLMGKTLN